MFDKAAAIAQVDIVLAGIDELRNRSKYDDLSDLKYELDAHVVRAQAAIDRLTLPGSTYATFASQNSQNPSFVRLPILAGTLVGLRADLEADYLSSVSELLHADAFSDFLGMAEELLVKGYKDAAAVLAGSVLESHLRNLCKKHGVATMVVSGKPKKADVMNADLVKSGVYNTLEQKGVTADLGLRNSAAHGAYGDYNEEQVRNLIRDIGQFVVRNPA